MKTLQSEVGVQERVQSVHHYGYARASYQAAYLDPITMKAGEELLFAGKKDNWGNWTWLWCSNQQGKSGWVPQNFVDQTTQGYIACRDYDAQELSVLIGEALLVSQFESGWYWCRDQYGESGWVPAESVLVLSNLLMDGD